VIDLHLIQKTTSLAQLGEAACRLLTGRTITCPAIEIAIGGSPDNLITRSAGHCRFSRSRRPRCTNVTLKPLQYPNLSEQLPDSLKTMNVPCPSEPLAAPRKHSGIAGGKRKTRAFTLVEMLVVVSIILLVAVVALPGIASLSKSAARRSSASLVMGAMDGARALAVSQSANCFIVFANGNSAIPANYRYRAFAVFQETYVPVPVGSAAAPYHLLMVQPWTLLPEGVCFRPDGAGADGPTVFSAPTRNIFCKPAKDDIQLPCIPFTSVGTVDQAPNAETTPPNTPITPEQARVKLFEGFIDAAGNPVTTNAAKSLADETITVSLFTGRAKRDEVKTKETNAPS
jgi:prepilin-type N-terminal cleavage/methylation domain-containing protein